MRKHHELIGIIAILACGAATLHSYAHTHRAPERTITERSFSAEGVARVKASVAIGKIHVFADGSHGIQIRGVRTVEGGSADLRRRWLTETKLTIEQKGNTIVIEDVIPKSLENEPHSHQHFRTEMALELSLPAPVAVKANLGVGDIMVEGRHGDTAIQTGAGNVQMKQLDCDGQNLEAHTGAGNIDGNGKAGNVQLTSGAGSIHLRSLESSGRTMRVSAGVGDIDLHLRTLPAESLSLSVGTGSVRLGLPTGVQASVNMESGMGSVHSAFPLHTTRHDAFEMGGHISGNIHGGGTKVHVHAGVGEIHLEQE